MYYTGGKIGIGKSDPRQVLDITGNIAVSGTVDGIDVSTLSSTVSSLKSNVNNNHLAYELVSQGATATAEAYNGGSPDSSPGQTLKSPTTLFWEMGGNISNKNLWLKYELLNAFKVTRYSFTCHNSSGYINRMPTSWNLMGSIDDQSWILLHTINNFSYTGHGTDISV